MSVVIDIAAQFTGQKAFRSAENAADKLGRTVKHALIGVGVTAFAKSAISAFSQQQKQLATFSQTLSNIGFKFATQDSLEFLNTLKLQYGVADSLLIPAYEQLLTTTRSLAATQNLTNTAMNIAAQQNISVADAADALSKAYLGNTKGIAALGLGISKATLASGDFALILKEINTITKGAAAASANTFAGKLSRIKIAADQAKESIGAGLVGALMALTDTTNIEQLQQSIMNFGAEAKVQLERFGKLISDNIGLLKVFGTIMVISFAVTKVAVFVRAIQDLTKAVTILKNAAIGAAIAEAFMLNPIAGATMGLAIVAAIGATIKGVDILTDKLDKANEKSKGMLGFAPDLVRAGYWQDKAKADRAAATAAKAQLKATLAATKAAKEKALVDKNSVLFNKDQIEIMAALQRNISDDEKLRLQLQLALLQGNGTEADRLGKQLAISQLQTTNLAISIANIPMALNPFKGWGSEIDNLLAKLIDMYKLLQTPFTTIAGINAPSTSVLDPNHFDAAGRYIGTPFGQAGSNVSTNIGAQGGYDMAMNYVGTPFGQAGSSVVNNYNISGATQGLIDELRNGLLDSSASGSFSLSNRATRGD